MQIPSMIAKLRALKANPNRQGYSDLDPVSVTMSVESETTTKHQRALPFTASWSNITESNSGSMLGDDATIDNEPSPVDWEQWVS